MTDRLDQALTDLKALPALYAELTRCATEKPPADNAGGSGGKPGSKPPVRLEVVHLTDGRRKPGWDGADPRVPMYELTWGRRDDERHSRLYPTQDAAWAALDQLSQVQQDTAVISQRKARDEYGLTPWLETWTRVLSNEHPDVIELAEVPTEMTEVASLVEHWGWIVEQPWADDLAADISAVRNQLKAALYVRKEPRYRCPQCNDRAQLVAGGFLTCPSGHEQSVRDLEAQWRRRPPQTERELADEFGIDVGKIRVWASRRKLVRVRREGRVPLYLPWDVLRLANPDIAAAFDLRDEQESA